MEYYKFTQDDKDDWIKRCVRDSAVKRSVSKKDTVYYAVNTLGIKPLLWQVKLWDMLDSGKKRVMVCTPRQCGKAQPLYSKVLTPEGYTTMGEIEVGDLVIGSNGLPAEVLDVFPQGVKDNFRLTFDDKTTTECCGEHLWKYHTAHQRHVKSKAWRVHNLDYLYNEYYAYPNEDRRISIPVVEPVKFKGNQHIIPPYTMGALLGDGCLKWGCSITVLDKPIIERIKSELPNCKFTPVKKSGTKAISYNIVSMREGRKSKLLNELRRLDLFDKGSHSKFIPREYLLDSVENRIELLRGLMDTDGSIYGFRAMEYCTVSKRLRDDVIFLIQSLGGKALLNVRHNSYGEFYRIMVKHNEINPFYLERKADKWYPIKYSKERILRSIEPIGQTEMKCILVDNEDHTYLTDNCIVTHNSLGISVFALKAASLNILPSGVNKTTKIGIISASEEQSKKVMANIRELIIMGDKHVETMTGGKTKNHFTNQIDKSQSASNNKSSITFTNGNQIICLPPTGRVRGYSFSLAFVDEAAFIESDDFYDTDIEPTTNGTNGLICLTSTPNGQKGFYYNFFDPDERYDTHTYDRFWLGYHDLPEDMILRIEAKKVDMYKTGREKQFKQEYEALFTVQMEAFFDSEDVDNMFDKSMRKYDKYDAPCDLGVDFGMVNSHTTLTVSRLTKDNIIERIYSYRYDFETDDNLIEDIETLKKRFNIQRIIPDNCAEGFYKIQEMEKKGWRVTPMNFKKDKIAKYTEFRSRLRQGKIKSYKDMAIEIEMKAMQEEEGVRMTKIHKPSGGTDDLIDCFVMSCYHYLECGAKGITLYEV